MITIGNGTFYRGDCLEVMRSLPDASVDSVVCDPPYGLSKEPDVLEVVRHWAAGDDYVHKGGGFMGRSWDSFVPGPSVWREAFRVLKPGGHLVAFFGTRTYDLGTLAIRMAGFEIRDQLAWVYGTGFPKSLDVSKAIDKAAGAEREKVPPRSVIGHQRNIGNRRPYMDDPNHMTDSDVPVTDEARQWQGWETALKPAWEPICFARKPLAERTVAANVVKHGTGAINVDGCRVPTDDKLGGGMVSMGRPKVSEGWDRPWMHDHDVTERKKIESAKKVAVAESLGRHPANLMHDGSEEVVALFPAKAGAAAPVHKRNGDKFRNTYGAFAGNVDEAGSTYRGDSGSAARFFYCAKASQSDRGEGNDHPTVKPTALMQWLCRLVTQPGGVVLDPFLGSGSTAKAAHDEGFRFIGIERDESYYELAVVRLWEHVTGC